MEVRPLARLLGVVMVSLVVALARPGGAIAQVAGKSGSDDLVIADGGKTQAVVVVSPSAGAHEKMAAQDLVRCIGVITGAAPALANTDAAITEALKAKGPVLIVGSEALKASPSLKAEIDKAAKKDPVLRADSIAVRRKDNRVYIAGNNDDAHYYAVAWLLREWGCRWYIPTAVGECLPEHATLKVGKLNHAYGPGFEVRSYWISWNGSNDGAEEFRLRNFMNYGVGVSCGHAIGAYTKELVPEGKSVMNIPIAPVSTADHIAKFVGPTFEKGQDVSLGMEDGVYVTEHPLDKQLQAGLHDKYFLVPVLTDNFMTMYNRVASQLTKAYPASKAKLGFLAYTNIMVPPQTQIIAEKPLVAYLAPIDTDPNHSMDDRRSPARQEYREMMYRWSHVMQGRVVIYDYDQGMLIWRDVPNPAVQAFRTDVKHYAKAGILGVATESRNAIGTVFLNLYHRGQLMWNPDADVDAMVHEFPAAFYGPAAKPMAAYWAAIQKAWDDTIVTEHEYFSLPAIYTNDLVKVLRGHLEAAEASMKATDDKQPLPRDWKKYQERMKFTRLSFNMIDTYVAVVRAAATEADYPAAAALGIKAREAQLALANANPTYTTCVVGVAAQGDNSGPAWTPGEMKQYRDLAELVNGARGTLIAKLPLEWAYRRDPNDTGLPSGFAYKPADLTYWKKNGKDLALMQRKDYPTTEWEMLRTDLYAQAQGVLHPDWQSFTGYHWYKTDIEIKGDDVRGNVHLLFPGLFNEAWLYVNGNLVAHRPQLQMWWLNDYKFEWDVDLAGKLKPGKNDFTVRLHNTHHFGGMFRRPLLYRAKAEAAPTAPATKK